MTTQARRVLLSLLTCAAIGLGSTRAWVAPSATAPQPFAFLPWDTAVGRVVGQEGDSEGPKSFAVMPHGGVLVLDQARQQVLELDDRGRTTRTIALPSSTFDDVEQFEGRAVLALDRLVSRTLLVLDAHGARLTEVALEGRGIEHAGQITALLPRPDGVWLEVRHRHSVKVLDRNLAPCDRQIVLGRPAANGKTIIASLDGRGGVQVSSSPRNRRATGPGVRLVADAPIDRIVWTDIEANGQVHVVLHAADVAPEAPYRVRSERYWMVVLDSELHEIRRSASPWVLTEADQRVEFRLGADGRLWQMAFAADGVRLIDWGRRGP